MGQKRFRRFCTGAVSLVALGVALEILLRLVVDYNPSYYVGFYHQQDKTIVFPYGIIHYNSRGYPDGEFLPQKIRPRIGYFGDSVCYGVGAGFGYRVSDLP